MTNAPLILTTEQLDEWQAMLRERQVRAAGLWRAPLPADVVAETVAQLGLTVPDEVATWWSWHNGVDSTKLHERRVSLGWEPLSVDDAVASTPVMRQVYEELGEPSMFWRDSWLELCFDGSHGAIACDTAGAADGATPVHHHDDHLPSRAQPVFPSLGELVSFWMEALRDGTLRVGPEGFFAVLSPDEMDRARGDLADVL